MDQYRDLIGANVKSFRKRKELSQSMLAELTSLSTTYIAEIETSRKIPSLKVLVRIARTLSVEPYRLLMDHKQEWSEHWEEHTDELIADITNLINQYRKRM